MKNIFLDKYLFFLSANFTQVEYSNDENQKIQIEGVDVQEKHFRPIRHFNKANITPTLLFD